MLHDEIEQAFRIEQAAIAQLGERQTEDLKVPGSIPGLGIFMIASDFCIDWLILKN